MDAAAIAHQFRLDPAYVLDDRPHLWTARGALFRHRVRLASSTVITELMEDANRVKDQGGGEPDGG